VPVAFSRDLGGGFDALSLFGRNGVLEARVPTGNLGYPVYAVTSDGGQTWRARVPRYADASDLTYAGTGPPLSFSPIDPLHWRASVFDRVFATDDGGFHWRQISTLRSLIIEGLSFSTSDIGWAFTVEDCGGDSCRFHLEATRDAGRTWHEVRALVPR
jgi:photosystem II stability/assembly factor-like uncharacterized protein